MFVGPSVFEPFGIVFLEALACGTAVIATNIGGIPEVVRNNIDGILVRPNDPKELAEAIDYLLINKNTCKKMGFSGRARVVSTFSQELITEKLISIYSELENS